MMWEAFAGLMLAAFCGGMLAMWPFAHRAGLHDGYEEGRADRHEAQIAENRARRGRHERTGPRTSLVRELAPDPAIWERPVEVGGPVALPSRWYAEQMAARWPRRYRVTTAADIAPVVLPEPGSYPPQPGRDSGDGTLTFPKIRLELATTGEIRAIGDEMVAAIEAAGEAS